MRRLFFFALIALSTATYPTKCLTQNKSPDPFHDYLVRSYPAQLSTHLESDGVERLQKNMDCQRSPIISLIQSIVPLQDDGRTVFIYHLASWESRGDHMR